MKKRNWYLVRVIFFTNSDGRKPILSKIMNGYYDRVHKEVEFSLFRQNGIDMIGDFWFLDQNEVYKFLDRVANN